MDTHCPNCHFEGAAKEDTKGCLQLAIVIVLFAVSCVFWPLFFLTIAVFLVFVFGGKKWVCPTCKWQHPIPLGQYRAQAAKGS
jgi:hypothetical protein